MSTIGDRERRQVGFWQVSQVVGAARGCDLLLAETRPGVRRIMLVQLDVTAAGVHGATRPGVTRWAVARQTARLYKVEGIPCIPGGVQLMYMDAKFVLGRWRGLLLRVNRPHSKRKGPDG